MILSDYAIKFRIAVFVFISVIIVSGIYNYRHIPREGAPDITIPYVFVTAVYEGTVPAEMEKLVTSQLEKYCNDVDGVKEIRSSTAEGISLISIEFIAGYDIDKARQAVKNKVDLAKVDLPEDIDSPIVDAFNFSSDRPIFIFALSGNTDIQHLKNIADDLQDDIELIPSVKEVSISGAREREIRVEIDLFRLISYKIPINMVLAKIARENKTISAGNLKISDNNFQVRVPGEFNTVSEIGDIIINERNGAPIYLRDIATIKDSFKDINTISRLNGNPSISVLIKKRSGENVVNVCDRVKKMINSFNFPGGIEMTVVMDESDYVRSMIKELENNISSGFILVIIVLLLFMGKSNSIFVALAIPFSMLIAFTTLQMMGFTLNMVVLFSLVLSVGMLVDNAIVIVENIYRHRSLGLTKIEAASKGSSEVAWPVITSTLTTLAAFSPLLFWPDIIGQFMGILPRTLIVILLASLFVGIIINPAICSALITTKSDKISEKNRYDSRFMKSYESLLTISLKYKTVIMLISVVFFVFTIMLYVILNRGAGKGAELFPETEPRNATISLTFPQGTTIERTDYVLKKIEKNLRKYKDIKFTLSTAGSKATGKLPGTGTSGTHEGYIHVEFLNAEDREGSTSELTDRIRDEIGDIAGAEISVEKFQEGPPRGAPISIEVSGDDFDLISQYATEIMRKIKTVPGLVDLYDDFEEALPELQFRVNRNQAALYGLDPSSIGLFLRTSIYGMKSTKFRSDINEYDITVRLPEDQRNSIDLLKQISIPTAKGKTVPLSNLGEFVYVGGKGSISRKDRKRVIIITGNTKGRTVPHILKDIRSRIRDMKLPHGYAIEYMGDTKDMHESMAFLSRSFLIALGIIFVILVIQFNSVLLPLIIIFSVVLSLVGVVWGMIICDMRISIIMTGLGVISLAGIVVNNAIVLVDCIIQRSNDGLDVDNAIISAGKMRMRPVLLTAVTTILGLIPMAIGLSIDVHTFPPAIIMGAETSDWWRPMAVAVIFGLGVATVLTLVMVPVMYRFVFDLRNLHFIERIRKKL